VYHYHRIITDVKGVDKDLETILSITG